MQMLIYGAGGFAREVAWLAEVCGHDPVAFIDDAAGEVPAVLNGYPVLTLEQAVERFPGAGFAAAIGSPKARRAVTEKAQERGLRLLTLVHPRAEMSRFVEYGEGAVICAGNILTTNIRTGKGLQLNLDCTVGHDCVFGDYVTVAPGAHISGNVHIGSRAYIGTGAAILNGNPEAPLVIGEDAVVGAAACVTKSVAAGVTVAGVPARPLEKKAAAHGG